MPRGNKVGDSRMPEIEERLQKRYASKGATSQDARKRAKAEVSDRASGDLNAGFGKGQRPKGSSSRNVGTGRTTAVRRRSDKEKKESAARKPTISKAPGQKRIRRDTGKTQS